MFGINKLIMTLWWSSFLCNYHYLCGCQQNTGILNWDPSFGNDNSFVCCSCFFSLSPLNQTKKIMKVMVMEFKIFCLCFSSGLKTYLISGRKLEHDVQCCCPQMGLSGGDFVGVSLSSCPQPRTPDLIPGGAQAAEPLLPHQTPDRIGVSQEKQKVAENTSI